MVGSDFTGESNDRAGVAREIAKLLRVVGEDDARERAGFVIFAEVEEDGAGGRSVRVNESAAHGSVFADVLRCLGIVDYSN